MSKVIPIEKDDLACHWVFDPKHFPSGAPECLQLNNDNFQFNTNNKYSISVNSKDLCKSFPVEIHTLGEKQAKNLNEISKKQQNYKGFIKALVGNIEGIENQEKQHHFRVQHDPTENYAHCNIKLFFPEGLKRPSRAIRGELVEELKEAFDKDIDSPD